jgi:hypothetical protein
LFEIRSGSLAVQGVDIVIPDQELSRADRVAAAGLSPAAQLTLTDCTLTLAGRRPAASAFVIQPRSASASGTGTAQPSGAVAESTPVIRLRNSFLRSGGDGITVASGRRLDLELANVLVATEGSLLHALGGRRPAPADLPAVKLRLSQVTARVEGGLVHLDSTPDEPELSSVDVTAENCVLSTADRDDPLFRLEGQNQLDELREKIHWDGHKIAYHRIKTYRRDEIVQTGVPPRLYNRTDWTNAFLPRDEAPLLGEVKFQSEPDAAQDAWKLGLNELRLAAGSPDAQVGPDLGRIPAPPADREL